MNHDDHIHPGSNRGNGGHGGRTKIKPVPQTKPVGTKVRPYVPRGRMPVDPKSGTTAALDMVFEGLFCHLTEENTVVMIDAHEHVLRLVVRDADLISATGFAQDFVHAEAGEHSYDISNCHLTITGTTAAGSTFDPAFMRDVPGLGIHAQCTDLRPGVIQRTLGDGIAGYLLHGGGAHSVVDYFPEKATFTANDYDAECIARKVRVRIEAGGVLTFAARKDESVTVRAGSEVRFVNTLVEGSATANQHFQHYYEALFACAGAVPRTTQTQQHCGIASAAAFPGADCSNSHNP